MHAGAADPRGRRRAGRVRAGVGAAIGLASVVLSGCAAPQIVPLSIEPTPVEVYVDGERVAGGSPESLSLRPDRSHVVLVRRAGYLTQQVVLESVPHGSGKRLTPERISLRLVPELRQGRRLEVELDPADDVPELR